MTTGTVLVADELADGADALAMLLDGAGYEARAVYSPDEAILMGESWKPRGAIVSMPFHGSRGFDVAHRLRASRRNEIRLVAYSRWDSPDDRERLMHAGFDSVVSRTAPPIDVLAAVSDEGRMVVTRSANETARRLEIILDLGQALIAISRARISVAESSARMERVRGIVARVEEGLRRLPLLEERARVAQRLAELERALAAAELSSKPRTGLF